MTSSGTHVTTRPSLAATLLRAWRTWHEHDPLLPTGPATSEDDRVRADLHAARPGDRIVDP